MRIRLNESVDLLHETNESLSETWLYFFEERYYNLDDLPSVSCIKTFVSFNETRNKEGQNLP